MKYTIIFIFIYKIILLLYNILNFVVWLTNSLGDTLSLVIHAMNLDIVMIPSVSIEGF